MFYEKRTIYDQMNRLPLDLRENYKNTQLDRIELDGELITGYFNYSFLEEKSYVEEPTRSQDGSISNIDDIPFILTPRVIINYNMMQIEDYRKVQKLHKTKNAFYVSLYDLVENKRVSHQMYFATPSMPSIYQKYLSVLGVKEYQIELIGTNNSASVTYNLNLPENVSLDNVNLSLTYTKTVPFNSATTLGIKNIDGSTLESISVNGDLYLLSSWNDKRDGSGMSFGNLSSLTLTKHILLFAQWRKE